MEWYASSPASVPESADNSAPSSSSSTTKSAKKSTASPYFPQSDNVSGSVVTRDANRIWQVAPRLSDRQFRDRQVVPPSSANQAQLRKLSIIAHLSRNLRAFDTDTGEPALEQRVVRRLTTPHDNYQHEILFRAHDAMGRRIQERTHGLEFAAQWANTLASVSLANRFEINLETSVFTSRTFRVNISTS